ncbi:unnamed protein product [Urochloa humidicola]
MASDRAGSSNSHSAIDLEAGPEIEMSPSVNGDVDGENEVVGSPSFSQPQLQLVTIPKVREQLRRAAGEYLFAPQTVVIGPYHRNKDGSCSFPWTEEKKKKAVADVEKIRVGLVAGLEQLLDEMGPQVRRCYTHLPSDHYMEPGSFTRMLLHDGCYLLSLFVEYKQQSGAPAGNLQAADGMIETADTTIVRDILYLAENQIPLFVLDRMLLHIIGDGEPRSALECTKGPVGEVLLQQHLISDKTQPQPSASELSSTPSHLLHLVHCYFRRRRRDEEPAKLQRPLTGRWRRATDYRRYANLHFECRKFKTGEDWTVLDIDLQGGTLYIPFLRVGSSTLTMLRNLMMLEEQEEIRPVTAYCLFMSQVACTAEDVDLLQRANVLEHFLGSDEQAAKEFAKLCDGVAIDIDRIDRNYLKPIWHGMDRRCGKPGHILMGFFCHEYCSNLFYMMVFLVALLVFFSEMVQGFYAPFGYHKPPK